MNPLLLRFPLDELAGSPPIREREFRARLNAFDFEPYRDRAVLIPWIHGDELPVWAYLMAAARLAEIVAVLSFGEACSPTVLLQKSRVRDDFDKS
jgi:hypothetical protein